MDDRQRKHNKRQVLRSRLRQHKRVLGILAALPPPAGLRVVSGDSGMELAATPAFARWSRIDWAAVPVECEATRCFDAGTKDIKRRDTASGVQKGLVPSGLSKQERVQWYARHARSGTSAVGSILPDELHAECRDVAALSAPAAAVDRDVVAALDSAAAAAADHVLNERFAQREARAARRTLRKRLQVESFAVVLNAVIEVNWLMAALVAQVCYRLMCCCRRASFRVIARHSLS
jgi:hypothetical protein